MICKTSSIFRKLIFRNPSFSFADLSKRVNYADVVDAKPLGSIVNFPTGEQEALRAHDGMIYKQKLMNDDQYLQAHGPLNRNSKLRTGISKPLLQFIERRSDVPCFQRRTNELRRNRDSCSHVSSRQTQTDLPKNQVRPWGHCHNHQCRETNHAIQSIKVQKNEVSFGTSRRTGFQSIHLFTS